MSNPSIDPRQPTQFGGNVAWFPHETEGWIGYDPSTMAILRGEGGVKHLDPISLPEGFVGTKQPDVATCSEPTQGNFGCPKWAACPFKKYPFVGPGNVIMRHHGTVSYAKCFEYYEVMRAGRPTSQKHYGIDGWEIDTTRTTIDVLGTVPVENQFGSKIGRKQGIWKMQVRGLLPPWWGLLKKQGLPLPEVAKMYPELVPKDEEEAASTPSSEPVARRSPSRAGRKKRTRKVKASSATDTQQQG